MGQLKNKMIDIQNGKSYFDENIGIVKGTEFEEILEEIEDQGFKYGEEREEEIPF